MKKELPLVKYSDGVDPDLVLRASENTTRIRDLSVGIVEQMLELGQLFYENRTSGYYRILGFDTWREFLGQPDIGYRESTVRGLMLIHRKYVLEMGVEKLVLSSIGFSKLRIVSPVVERDPAEWLAKANVLSKTDLRLEVAEAQGQEVGDFHPSNPSSELEYQTPLLLTCYSQAVTHSPCCVCGARPPSERAHWPLTKDPGDDPENLEWTIPLCTECHKEYHSKGDVTFFKNYKRKIGRYLFRLLLPIFNRESGSDQPDSENPIVIEAEKIPDRID